MFRLAPFGPGRQYQLFGLPPIHLGHVLDAAAGEPFLISQRGKEMHVGEQALDLLGCRVRQVIVVAVRYDDNVNERYIFDLTGHVGVSLGTHE